MKVVRITRVGRRDVYNMEVADTHDFVIQGGVISHNCADESRYFLMSRPVKPLIKEMHESAKFDPLDLANKETNPHKNIYKYNL